MGEAADGSEVLAALDRHRADVVLMDLRMPKVDGIGALELFDAAAEPAGGPGADDLRHRRSGAASAAPWRGRLPGQGHAARGDRARDRAGGGGGEHALADRHPPADRPSRPTMSTPTSATRGGERLATLTDRDREIAPAIAQGKSNAAIAAELHLSVATIKSHVSAMLAKLQLDNRVQIALLVQDAGSTSQMNRRRLASGSCRSAKPHYRNGVNASVSSGERGNARCGRAAAVSLDAPFP